MYLPPLTLRCIGSLSALLLLSLISACGDYLPSIGDSDRSEDLGTVQAVATAPWMSLDLADGSYSALADPGNLAATRWRETHILFRRIEPSSGPAYLAVFPITQAQWLLLGGDSPWEDIDTAVVDSSGWGDRRPAYGLSWNDITTTVQAWNQGRSFNLAVPSEQQWQFAARAGGNGPWPWGDDRSRSTVRDHALVWETLDDAPPAPSPVGLRNPNAFDFHDMAGLVWEWCHPGDALRGGSWRDGLWSSRIDNRLHFDNGRIEAHSDHALFGVRLALRP